MTTILDWIKKLDRENGVQYSEMPTAWEERIKVASPSIDGIFILGKGFVHFDNFTICNTPDDVRIKNPGIKWLHGKTEDQNLLLFFMNLTQSICVQNQKVVDIMSYLQKTEMNIEEYGFSTQS